MQNHSWESFFYGNTCLVITSGSESTSAAPKRNLSFKKVAVHLGLVAASLNPILSSGAILAHGGAVPAEQSRGVFHARNTNWNSKISRARKTLSLSLTETAELLHLSLSTLQKLDAGDTKAPHPETRRKYQLLIELESLLKDALHNRKFAISSALRSEQSAFSNLTALEFAKRVGEDGIDAVLDIFKRIHA